MATVSETTSATTTSSTAKAPTGDILAFVEAFNKEFDKVIEELKVEVSDAKLILASVSNITQLKQCSFPEGNTSVKTIGDLYKYSYNLDTGDDLSPKVKYFSGQVDLASAEIVSAFNKDIDGNTMIPKQDLKPLKSKILGGLNKVRSLNKKLALKTPQGKNPNLWSPGLYYFEYFHDEMKRYIKKEEEYGFGLDYLRALREGKETFTFSISSFTPDGNIIIKDSPFKAKGYAADDGQAGYSVFDSICQSKMENPYYTDMTFIATIGFQNNYQMWGDPPVPNKVPFQSLKTLYLSGNLEDLKSNPKFQFTRGELSKDETYFYGNWEFISLYKAFIQAGDNYEYVTFPFKKEEPKTTDSVTQSTTATQSLPEIAPAADEPKFIFNVEDEKTFFRKEPALELFVVPNTNNVPQQNQSQPKYRQEEIDLNEEALSDEYAEIELNEFQANDHVRDEEENAKLQQFAESNQVKDNTTTPPSKVVSDKEIITPNNQTNKTNETKETPKTIVEVSANRSYSVSGLPPNSTDKYSDLTKVPYYGQWDSRWGGQIYGSVTTKDGKTIFIEDPKFSKTFTVKNGSTSPRDTTYKMDAEDLKTGWSNNKFGPVKGKVNINGAVQDFEVQAHYEWHKLTKYKGCGDLGYSTINAGGCGITSLSMVVNYWGKMKKDQSKAFYTNPIKMAKLACENSGRPGSFPTTFKSNSETACSGTDYSSSLRKTLLETCGLSLSDIKGEKEISEQIKSNRPVLWCVKNSGGLNGKGAPKTYPGHYMVIAGKATINGEDVIIINDPGNNDTTRVVYVKNVSDLKGSFWKVEPSRPNEYS